MVVNLVIMVVFFFFGTSNIHTHLVKRVFVGGNNVRVMASDMGTGSGNSE